ncbi:MAG: DNA translocase FtsK [Alphaproteobacteria bacterium]
MIKNLWAHPRVKAVVFTLLAVIFGLSLASYAPTDKAWNTASNVPYHNWLGPVGAWSADALLQLMGQAAFLIPLAFLTFAVFLWLHLRWVKTRGIVLLIAFLLAMWLATTIPVKPEYIGWFKAGSGGFIGYYLTTWIPVPQGIWLILLWALCAFFFIFAFKIPALKITAMTGKGALWGVKKMPVHLPEKITKPFAALHVHRQIQKIKKAAPKAKIKAVKTPSVQPVVGKEGMALPSSELLAAPKMAGGPQLSKDQMTQLSRSLESVLAEFGVQGQVVGAKPGPVVTLYEFEPASGVKTSRVIALADDVAREMRAVSVRMALVPGSNVIGIEMPNPKREMVYIRELVEDEDFKEHKGALPIILGKNIGGKPVYADLAKMPHLLVAGTTGSGKSVGINTMILSLLYRFTPEQCRLIMVDPKMVELSVYNGIPHLLIPVITEPAKSLMALKWAVHEMEDRYRNMSQLGVRNIEGFNEKLKEAKEKGLTLKRRVQTGFDPATGQPIMEEQAFDLTPLPYIVFIIDEMADLMGQCGKEADPLIQRLAQMARAVGIHLILATQRPSVDVVTGTIKSNFPSRISFQVRNKIDSRTILDEQGAEQLLGKGDMLYMPAGNKPVRVHGPFVSDEDVGAVVKHWSEQGEPHYVEAVTADTESMNTMGGGVGGGTGDSLYDQAVAIVLRDKKPTTSYIQRRLSIGYNKAATLIEQMEKEGVISAPNAAGKREILVPGGE